MQEMARACERCHRNKEECIFPNHSTTCVRCQRIGNSCRQRQLDRKCRVLVVTGGAFLVSGLESLDKSQAIIDTRPKVPISTSVSGMRGSRRSLDGHSTFDTRRFPRLGCPAPNPSYPSCRLLGRILESPQAFFIAHRHFMLGQSFVDSFRKAVAIVFKLSPHLLGDAYRVVTSLLHPLASVGTNGSKQMNYSLADCCLRRFTHLSSVVLEVEYAALSALIGQLMVACNAMSPLASCTRHITRATLFAIRDWYPKLLEHPEFDAIVLTPVLVDTVECLFRREIPVLRLPIPNRDICDRLAGVCTSLLPLMYDLCVCSHLASVEASPDMDNRTSQSGSDQYTEVESKILAWCPTMPTTFWLEYSAEEQTAMLVQARTYRLAVLLIIHRLRFPLGTKGTIARSLATNILDEIASLISWPSDGATGLGLDFPLFVAMVEMPSRAIDMHISFERLRFRTRRVDLIEGFLRRLDEARMSGYARPWFDLVDKNFLGDFLP